MRTKSDIAARRGHNRQYLRGGINWKKYAALAALTVAGNSGLVDASAPTNTDGVMPFKVYDLDTDGLEVDLETKRGRYTAEDVDGSELKGFKVSDVVEDDTLPDTGGPGHKVYDLDTDGREVDLELTGFDVTDWEGPETYQETAVRRIG